jgi:hypothetical protein
MGRMQESTKEAVHLTRRTFRYLCETVARALPAPGNLQITLHFPHGDQTFTSCDECLQYDGLPDVLPPVTVTGGAPGAELAVRLDRITTNEATGVDSAWQRDAREKLDAFLNQHQAWYSKLLRPLWYVAWVLMAVTLVAMGADLSGSAWGRVALEAGALGLLGGTVWYIPLLRRCRVVMRNSAAEVAKLVVSLSAPVLGLALQLVRVYLDYLT